VAREFLQRNILFEKGAPRVDSVTNALTLLVHELCHDNDSREGGHSADFYRQFHDVVSGWQFGQAVKHICNHLTPAKWEQLKKK
jgi:hypothetical protein